jgi:accessory gene regulator protein AgrB
MRPSEEVCAGICVGTQNDEEDGKVAVQLRHGIWIVLGQLVLLIIALVVALVLAEVWLFGAITLLEDFPKRPVLASGILLSLFALLFLCLRGAKMDSRPIAILPVGRSC